ncbi:MAG: carboxypeptidase regulatory-like domain-containing protein, partial [Candidatus Acidiferrales bacterium]
MSLSSRAVRRAIGWVGLVAWILLFADFAWALAGGSLSGVLRDSSGGVVPGAKLTLVNTALKSEFKASSDARGFYSFPALPVGHYDLTIEAAGFQTQKRPNLAVDADSAVTVNAVLEVAQSSEAITVTSSEVETQVDTVATHLGDVMQAAQAVAIPLNGRAYTDLLAIQPGVSPVTTLTPTSVIMAGVTGTINPSGDANPGDVSIDGQRESANGFMVNGIDVQEHMNGGTSVIPNLDSIEEFRVLTINFDPEYGNYNGGMVNVITKSGSNAFHGDAFEFLRNTSLDAKNYFDSTRGVFRQNQFGGVLGGPIRKDKAFFFVDYQGTRTAEGITSPAASVPSLQDRAGNLIDQASSLTGTVSGPNIASLLTQELGYPVSQGELYYTSGCTSSASCVF